MLYTTFLPPIDFLYVIQTSDRLFSTKIFSNRDRVLSTAIEIPSQCRDVPIVDFVDDIFDRFVDCFRVFGSYRSLNNARSSNILANSSLKILGLLKGILLEPEFEVLVK